MSKTKKREVSKGRNLDMLGMILADRGGAHRNKRDKRKNNAKYSWRSEEV